MMVHFRFSPSVAKQASLLRTLMEFQGVNVSGEALSGSATRNGSDILLLGLEEGSPEVQAANREGGWERCLVMILNPSDAPPPPGVLEFSSDGVQRLLRRLGRPLRDAPPRPATAEEQRTPGPERRRWDLKRFRYGLWLEFARVTGSGKFDPYPLMNSKKEKIERALSGEMSKYRFDHDSSGPELLEDALDHVWDSFSDRFPCAVHVVDALAEHVWEAASPTMPDRRNRDRVGSDKDGAETTNSSTGEGIEIGVANTR